MTYDLGPPTPAKKLGSFSLSLFTRSFQITVPPEKKRIGVVRAISHSSSPAAVDVGGRDDELGESTASS